MGRDQRQSHRRKRRESPAAFQHACPICRATIPSCYNAPPTSCPACGKILLKCGICGDRIILPPVAYCRTCDSPLCIECRRTDDLRWEGLKWRSLCWKCAAAGA